MQEDRLLIEGQYWRAMNDSPKAVQAYSNLFHLYPDSLDYGLLLATAQIGAQPSAALQTLAVLRRLPDPLGSDARIDMTEASAWIGRDLVKARAVAKEAIAKGRAQERPVLVARTYGFLCQLNVGVGVSTQDKLSDCENARKAAGRHRRPECRGDDVDRHGWALLPTRRRRTRRGNVSNVHRAVP